MCKKIFENEDRRFAGCDFVLRLDEGRKRAPIRLLQITDMQVIDASQRRTPDRLPMDQIKAWDPALFDRQCTDHIKSLISQTHPDLIFITGDMVYGSFDDQGTTMEWFCKMMDSFEIPWAPTFGNHDNESEKGVDWQCAQLEKSKYCLFKRGAVSGNANYTIGIAAGDELVRVLHMADSNGCRGSEDPSVIKKAGLYADQLALFEENAAKIEAAQGRAVPAFMAFHIAEEAFIKAEIAKGYKTEERNGYVIGVDVAAKDGDFGCKSERTVFQNAEGDFSAFLKRCAIDGVFCGHCHNINTCITYEGVRYVYGLKTGQYDYHLPGQLGGTLVTLEGENFSVCHVPALVHYSPFPESITTFKNFFVEEDKE